MSPQRLFGESQCWQAVGEIDSIKFYILAKPEDKTSINKPASCFQREDRKKVAGGKSPAVPICKDATLANGGWRKMLSQVLLAMG